MVAWEIGCSISRGYNHSCYRPFRGQGAFLTVEKGTRINPHLKSVVIVLSKESWAK